MTDHALDALLAEYAPPPLSAGLAGRVAAAALALPQEPRLAVARSAGVPPRRDRRGAWLRRPALIAGVALGLVVGGAVAATLAGIKLDRLFGLERGPPAVSVGRETPPPTPPAPPPQETLPAAEPVPPGDAPTAIRTAPEPSPAAPAPRVEAPPVAAPVQAPPRPEIMEPRRIEMPPPAPPLPAIRQGDAASTPVAPPRIPAPAAEERLRLQREQRERIERTERLRAARQAQIERMQRLQQSRERIRRLRRD
ncbi:MAG TPA: hypothetical protein VGO55_07015 [Allosphingosinicella sp.]|jgi:hypothetical protein|nr:hypothetical protein [Allosphingosinicella sp.]